MKKLLATILLSLSSLEARSNQVIDDLLAKSDIIVSNIDYGIQAVGGFIVYAPNGGIAPDGTVQAGYISMDNMTAYNEALAAVANANFYSAQDYLYEQGGVALDNMSGSVDDFVSATLAIVTAIEVNRMAEVANESGSVADQEAIQAFIGGNDVDLTQEKISAYNQSLTDIESYGQDAAAYFAAGSNEDFLAEFENAADAYGESFLNATVAFDSASAILTLQWMNTTREFRGVEVNLSAYYKTADEYFAAGLETEFYKTSPIACGYDFSQCE